MFCKRESSRTMMSFLAGHKIPEDSSYWLQHFNEIFRTTSFVDPDTKEKMKIRVLYHPVYAYKIKIDEETFPKKDERSSVENREKGCARKKKRPCQLYQTGDETSSVHLPNSQEEVDRDTRKVSHQIASLRETSKKLQIEKDRAVVNDSEKKDLRPKDEYNSGYEEDDRSEAEHSDDFYEAEYIKYIMKEKMKGFLGLYDEVRSRDKYNSSSEEGDSSENEHNDDSDEAEYIKYHTKEKMKGSVGLYDEEMTEFVRHSDVENYSKTDEEEETTDCLSTPSCDEICV